MKKILYCIMSIYLVFATTTAAYASSPAGWAVSNVVMNGAVATITAFKNGAAGSLKTIIAHRPSAVAVGKHLIKGGAAGALAWAVAQKLGDGVDWVLDPANNSVKYKDPSAALPNVDSDLIYQCYLNNFSDYTGSLQSLSSSICGSSNNGGVRRIDTFSSGSFGLVCNSGLKRSITCSSASAGDGVGSDEKSIPINELAADIIAGAEAGNAQAQEAVKAVAVGAAESGALDADMDAAAEPTTENPPDTSEPTDPAEPFDPSSIIDAIKSLGAKLAAILSAITGLSDLFSDAPTNPENTEVPIEDAPPVRAPTEFDTEYVNFGGQCPSFGSHDISVGSVSVPLNIDITPLCELAELVRPAVIGGAYLAATGLVVAAIREA